MSVICQPRPVRLQQGIHFDSSLTLASWQGVVYRAEALRFDIGLAACVEQMVCDWAVRAAAATRHIARCHFRGAGHSRRRSV